MRGLLSIGICLVLQITSGSLVCAQIQDPSQLQAEDLNESLRSIKDSVQSLVDQVKELPQQQFKDILKEPPNHCGDNCQKLLTQILQSTDSLPQNLEKVQGALNNMASALAQMDSGKNNDPASSSPVKPPGVEAPILNPPPVQQTPWLDIVGACTLPVLIGLYFVTRKTIQNLYEQIQQEIRSQAGLLLGNPQQGETLRYSLRNLTDIAEDITRRLPEIEQAPMQVITRIQGPLGQIDSMVRQVVTQLQETPTVLREELEGVIQKQFREENQRSVEKKRTALMTRVQQSQEAAHQKYPILRLAEVIQQTIFFAGEDVQRSDAKFLESYDELVRCWKDILRQAEALPQQPEEMWGDEEQRLLRAIAEFERKANELKEQQKVSWFVPLLKQMESKLPADKLLTLKNALEIEDIRPQEGSEINWKECEAERLEGESGTHLVVGKVVNPGYRDKTTGTILEKAKVVTRTEG